MVFSENLYTYEFFGLQNVELNFHLLFFYVYILLYIAWKFSSGIVSPRWSRKKGCKNGCGGGSGYVYIVMPSVL